VSTWCPVEIYSHFVRVTGEIEVPITQRLSDVINRVGEFLEMRDAVTEPLSSNHPVLAKQQPHATLAKGSVTLICPLEPGADRGGLASGTLWREKERCPMAITTQAYSMVADVHLEPRLELRDQLERYRGDFLPLTNVSALWVAALAAETHALQREFALLNPAQILSFAPRE